MSDRITIEITGVEELDRLITNLDSALGRQVGETKRLPRRGAGVNEAQLRALKRELLTPRDALDKRLDLTGKLTNTQLRNLSRDVAIATSETLIRDKGLFKGLLVQFKTAEFPIVNRNLRTLMRQVPYGSSVSQTIFGTRRLQRSLIAGGIEGAVGIAATLLIIFGTLSSMRRQMQVQNQQYKQIFLEYKPDLTVDEFNAIKDRSTDNWGKFTNWIFGVS